MKRILLILTVLIGLIVPLNQQAFAFDVIPTYVSMVFTNTLGVYQAANEITLYKEPSLQAPIVHNIRWNNNDIFPHSVNPEDLFIVYMPSKNLGLLAVTDETEDWVQVMYNNTTGAKGWVKKDDPYKFMPWISFYNIYGKKYGLKLLKSAPKEISDLHTATDEKSQVVGRMNMPEKINLNVIRGNWALVSVYDLDRIPKTGYIRWRADNGTKYYFPDIK